MLGRPEADIVIKTYPGASHFGRSNGGNAGSEDEAILAFVAKGKYKEAGGPLIKVNERAYPSTLGVGNVNVWVTAAWPPRSRAMTLSVPSRPAGTKTRRRRAS